MGLSTQERTSQIASNLIHLNKLRRKLQKTESCDEVLLEIIKCIDSCWHCFTGKTSNSIHWLIGSSSSAEVSHEDESLWAMAIRQNLPYIQNWYSKDLSDIKFQEQTEEKDYKFNFIDYHLTIPKLLECSNYDGTEYSIVVQIYQNLEDIVYALRRYKDEYLKDKKDLSENVSKLFGLCFEYLSKGDSLSRAYVLHNICLLICNDRYYQYTPEDKWDVVLKVIHDMHFYHSISKAMGRLSLSVLDLSKLHVKLALAKQNDKDFNLQRLLALIEIVGPVEYFVHQETKLFKTIGSDNSLKRHVKTIKAAIEKQKENWKKEKDKESQKLSNNNKWIEAYSG